MSEQAISAWDQVTSFETLYYAWTRARKGKRMQSAVARYALNLEEELLTLRDELRSGHYRPAPHRVFMLYERKPRTIAAPALRDRIVHHALMAVIGPGLDAAMHPQSYACRVGYGVHKAVDYYQQVARRFPYVLKLDVRQYFPSIRHDALRRQLAVLVKDQRVRWLINQILAERPPASANFPVSPGRGLPIGNLTSQIFANVYLSGIDHFVAGHPACGAYLRYVDDLFLLGDNKQALWALCAQLQTRLSADLGLVLHPNKIHCRRTCEKVDVLGYQVSPQRRWLRADNGHRFRRRFAGMVKAFHKGRIGWPELHSRVGAWIGHAMHGETHGLRRVIFLSQNLARASART